MKFFFGICYYNRIKLKKVVIVNYGGGNSKSVCNALDFLGCNYTFTSDSDLIKNSTHIILPGVGSYSGLMASLKKKNLIEILQKEIILKKKYYLGICVGMQILSEMGTEFGDHKGLGWIKGKTKKLEVEKFNLTLPHVGWNELRFENGKSKILTDKFEGKSFYFVNSFYLDPLEKLDFIGVSYYGHKFTSVIEKNNIFGIQFHPEKSQKFGIEILKNFINL